VFVALNVRVQDAPNLSRQGSVVLGGELSEAGADGLVDLRGDDHLWVCSHDKNLYVLPVGGRTLIGPSSHAHTDFVDGKFPIRGDWGDVIAGDQELLNHVAETLQKLSPQEVAPRPGRA
jgi:hypothetical protein